MSDIGAGMQEIYKQMMLIDLFETHHGWVSNLPEHIKVLAGVMVLILLAIMIFGLYSAYLNLDHIMKKMNKLVETISAHFNYEVDAPKRVKP